MAAEEELQTEPLVREPGDKDALYLLDVRGVGESLPDDPRGLFHPYNADYLFHGFSGMLGESYFGRRVFDVLRTLDPLAAEGADEVSLAGRGQGGILALFAGLLHPRVTRLTLKNAPSTFHEWTQSPEVVWPCSSFPRGILRVADLPDLLEAFPGRVRIHEPWGPSMDARRA